MKFKSSRLRDSNYKIKKITLDDARQNQEVIRLSNSELIRAIQRIRGIDFNQSYLDELLRKKKKRKHSLSLNEEIDKLLYIEDIIDVEFDDARHYETVSTKKDIWINGKKYVRLLCSAGMGRRSTTMFANEEIVDDLRTFLNCGRDPNFEAVPNKWSAYYALASSATLRVSYPNFVVIPDCEVEKEVDVDFLQETIDENIDPEVIPMRKLIGFNLFDGQGLISPRKAKEWASELDCDYLPATWTVRCAFLKGMLATFDFHLFAKEHNIDNIKDIYGKDHFVEDVDIIISESQFKGAKAYSSIEDYNAKCKEHDFAWGISRVSHSIEKQKNHAFTTYQYIQNLNITTQEQIESLCKKTVDWFNNVTGEDWVSTSLFLLGDVDKSRLSSSWFESLDNPLLQSLLLEPKLINDKQIQSKIQRLINKKIKESYLGNLLIDGNYQTMISDPISHAEWALGLEFKEGLGKKEYYSNYWNQRNINKVSAIRSPMTYWSENNVLDLVQRESLSKWYKYLYTGTIYNIWGADTLIMSGNDFDADENMTTSQKEFVECAYQNILPPTYDRKSASKSKIDESVLWQYDIKTFNSRIGFYTNLGAEFSALLPLYEKGSEEYKELINRLKICNCLQSMEIDRAKGIKTMDIPKYWTKWQKISDEDSEETKKLKRLHQKTIADKRPYFFRYLYPDYEKQYKQRIANYDNYCWAEFGRGIFDIINASDKSKEEQYISDRYYRFAPLLESDSVMNNVCRYMESEVKELKRNHRLQSYDFKKLFYNSSEFQDKNRKLLKNVFEKYQQYKKSINYHTSSSGFKEMMEWLREQIDGLIDTSDEVVYWGSDFGASFLLDVFPTDLLSVLKEHADNKVMIPLKSNDGYIKYMGSTYEIEKIEL